MQLNGNIQTSTTLDRVLGFSLAAFSMFIVGYTATRVYFDQATGQNLPAESDVIPHQASLWSELGH
ncbi:MAG: hypothetical protein WA919_01990 [Coleofasciculaceae cyanobacterium]